MEVLREEELLPHKIPKSFRAGCRVSRVTLQV